MRVETTSGRPGFRVQVQSVALACSSGVRDSWRLASGPGPCERGSRGRRGDEKLVVGRSGTWECCESQVAQDNNPPPSATRACEQQRTPSKAAQDGRWELPLELWGCLEQGRRGCNLVKCLVTQRRWSRLGVLRAATRSLCGRPFKKRRGGLFTFASSSVKARGTNANALSVSSSSTVILGDHAQSPLKNNVEEDGRKANQAPSQRFVVCYRETNVQHYRDILRLRTADLPRFLQVHTGSFHEVSPSVADAHLKASLKNLLTAFY
ncbi:hypothetical protein P154DRAFT_578890 [Amniculicola lignicola CBS 123094]|uniref:Uncharacterized protein n=1 Tax=Amniculicola lignicola CBS 123094 TaxID=1392246 RepID=A0A6A5WBE2_9PLEO|nr:hypothetical protein P154DRAFT_578890 [Amniculicola lignicola CBS 123094]